MPDDTKLSLVDVDVDGAIGEALEASTDTRAGFLRRAGLSGAAIVGGGAFAGALPRLAGAATITPSDRAILNFALTLEYLEAAFYADAVARKKLKGETRRFAQVVASHENSHVLFLRKMLGSSAIAQPEFDFKGITSDQAKFEATADMLENTGVHAYLGQVPYIKAKDVLLGTSRILPVEARHAAWIRDIRFRGGKTSAQTPAPAGFEDGFTRGKILDRVNALGFFVS
jgi:hypothetical protein